MVEETTTQQHHTYERIHASREFTELRRRYRAFAFPMTVAFMVWYLLYVLASSWANGFMATQVIGNINVALVFGLLQFVSTFLIAWLYARHATQKLDPIADRLRDEYDSEVSR
jgi:uncharacterized membrane protein (DUF485 family)